MERGDVRIFQIGFNRCGTKTLHSFFAANGFACLHWQQGHLARNMFQNLANGVGIFRGYERVQVFSDMEWVSSECVLEGYKLFPLIAARQPNAVFILNTRDREEWVASRAKHEGGSYLERWMHALGFRDPERMKQHWRDDWDRHHLRVRNFFQDQPGRLIEFDIRGDATALANALPSLDLDSSRYVRVIDRETTRL